MSRSVPRVLALVGERDERIPGHRGIEAALTLFERDHGRALHPLVRVFLEQA